jgi:SAM-dependent methyltransferase
MVKRFARAWLARASRIPFAWEAIVAAYQLRNLRNPWLLHHPIDRQYGTSTAGFIPAWLLGSGGDADAHVVDYAGCQPSCVRRALDSIPSPSSCSFVDLGCGKGRALIVAPEYPFRQIIGVELSPKVAQVARRNARISQQRFPNRTPVQVVTGNAATVSLPTGDLAIFLYHPFHRALFERVLSNVRQTLGEPRTLFLILENPVNGGLVDSHARFVRWFSDEVPCDPDERQTAHVNADAVVVWRADPDTVRARPEACKQIVPIQPNQVTLLSRD